MKTHDGKRSSASRQVEKSAEVRRNNGKKTVRGLLASSDRVSLSPPTLSQYIREPDGSEPGGTWRSSPGPGAPPKNSGKPEGALTEIKLHLPPRRH